VKIFGWLADHAGCGWYRIMLPLGALEESGAATTQCHGNLLAMDLQADVVVAQRIYAPGPTQHYQRIARATGDRPLLVYELDDDLLNLSPDNPSSKTFGDPEVQARIRANIGMADLVTVSTEPLAEQIAKINPRVAVLPNCIPSDMLQWQHGGYADRLTLGWQGSPTHAADWAVASKTVTSWFKQLPHRGLDHPVELHAHGGIPDTFPDVPNTRRSDWDRDIARYYMSIDWDVALAPLQNNQFNLSKSDIRVLEAAMLGIPVIASDVPAYRASVQHGVTGFLASRPGQWRYALDAFAFGQWGDLMAMGRAARKWAATRTIEANADRWLDAYTRARSG